MCGILGIISSTNQTTIDDSQVMAMRDTMTARGPDDSGLFRKGPITLAHRRLAIRDLAAGQQPWITRNGRFGLVYNGEIYNDTEIKAALSQRGVVPRTNCDTELLAEAWSIWGQDCLGLLRGMFAFGVVDLVTNEYWIVRDRCGIKPLFYTRVDGDFVFASSIAALRRHPRFSSRPNFTAISHYMQTLRITMGRETVFQNVFSLLPAEIIHGKEQDLNHRIYWSLPQPKENNQIEFEESVVELNAAIEDSVRMRLKSDVPVGMMMSGGVDSNTLATVARRETSNSVLGVCGGGLYGHNIEDPESDFSFAKTCADKLGFDYAEARVSDQDYLETWQHLIAENDTPLATPTDAIIFQVAKQLKQQCGVAIGGEGADEAFCGYAIAHWCGHDYDRANSLQQPGLPSDRLARESLITQYGRDSFDSMADHYLSTSGLIPTDTQKALFSPSYWCDGISAKIRNHYETTFRSHGELSMAEKYARVLFEINLESLLGRLDSSTMAASLEARVPFTDHVLVEKAFAIPHGHKIDLCPTETQPWRSSLELNRRGSLRSKRVLRSIASRIMPEKLALRPKKSFPTPLATWIDQNWKTWVNEKLLNSSFANEIFQRSALEELARFPKSLAMWKWPVLNTVLWGERCFR